MNAQSPIPALTDPDASTDELDRAIVTLSARIDATTHDLLILIRRYDERAGWLRWGFDNCVDWLHWRCDLSRNACRERVRVAHALKTLPAIAMAFARGELSYTKVRALTRVANADNEEALLTFALQTTAARVEERCRELRCGTVASTDEANRAHARRALTIRRNSERGTMTITVELPLETGELIDKALDCARDDSTARDPELAEESWAAQQADALVGMAAAYLGGGRETSSGVSDKYTITTHVDLAALIEGKGRSGLPIETVRRLGCDADALVIVENERGEPLSVGRKTRIVPKSIDRAVWARDKCCRFPGCGRKRFVNAHHIEHWANGGETSLANLMLLCTQHHRLIHEGGFRLDKDYQDRWFFRRPDGRAVPACGYRAADMTDDDVDTADEDVRAYLSGKVTTHPPEGASMVREPSAEPYVAGNPRAVEVGRASAEVPGSAAPRGGIPAHAAEELLSGRNRRLRVGEQQPYPPAFSSQPRSGH